MTWPGDTLDSHIRNRIYYKLYQKTDKYRAGKLSDGYMRKYLIKNTNLNRFEINDVLKLIKTESKLSIYSILNRIRPNRPNTLREDILDLDNPDFDNVRKKYAR